MRVKTIIDEDFTNYRYPAMFIGTISCGGKCCVEAGIALDVCHNDGWRSCIPVAISNKGIIDRYLTNPLTQAIVFGGLEPFEQWEELYDFITEFRHKYGNCLDDIVIYTGYRLEEITTQINELKRFSNIIIKYGRYIPNKPTRYDDILGIHLSSDNQWAERIS